MASEQSTSAPKHVHLRIADLLERLQEKRESLVELHQRYDRRTARELVTGDDIYIAQLLSDAAQLLMELRIDPAHPMCDEHTDQIDCELFRLLRVRKLIRTQQNPFFD